MSRRPRKTDTPTDTGAAENQDSENVTFRSMTLDCKLEPDELAERANKLARDLSTHYAETDTAKAAAKEAADAKKLREEKIADLARVVSSGVEYREVQVQDRRAFRRRKMETIRLDTGKVISTRPLAPDELNLDLFPLGDDERNESETTH